MKRLSCLLVVPFVLSACGGGGSATPEAAPTTVASGGSTKVSATYTGTGYSTAVQSIGAVSAGTSSTSIVGSMTVTNQGNIASLTINHSDGTTETFNVADGDEIYRYEQGGEVAIGAFNAAKTSAVALLVADNAALANVSSTSGNTFTSEARYAGDKTNIDPSTVVSTATYNGYLMGTINKVGTTPHYSTARVTMAADFDARTIAFSTSDIAVRNMNDVRYNGSSVGNELALNYLLSGTLSDADNDYTYSGTISDAGGRIGTLGVDIIGSDAGEVAGAGSVTDNTTTTHVFSVWGER